MPDLPPGFIYELDQESRELRRTNRIVKDTSGIDWVPAKSKQLGGQPISGKAVEGRHDYLDITFPKTKLRIPAHVTRVSDSADVALIKIDLPQPVTPIQVGPDDKVNPGEAVTVLDYPGVSKDLVTIVESADMFNREADVHTVPDVTVSNGLIAKIIDPQSADGRSYSSVGHIYQLTINSTGAGNSGGPVLNEEGRAVAIFSAGSTDGRTNITYAVPIKYGVELMGVQRVIK
jgi:serine protease Do